MFGVSLLFSGSESSTPFFPLATLTASYCQSSIGTPSIPQTPSCFFNVATTAPAPPFCVKGKTGNNRDEHATSEALPQKELTLNLAIGARRNPL
jgi:hypothetical protein